MNESDTKSKTTKYDVLVAEKGRDGKTYWHRIGVAFPNTKSFGMTLRFYGNSTSYVIMESQRTQQDKESEHEDTAF